MRSINKVILIGNLTRDPELKKTTSGQPIVTFGIATNRDWATREGEHHSSSEFHEIVAWSKLAELCAQHLKKGKLVYIEGYLKTRSWDAADGTKKYRTEIVANDMIMLEKRPANNNGSEDNFNFSPENSPMTSDEMPLEEMSSDEAA